MLTFTTYKPMTNGEVYVEGNCLTTDAKPTQGIYNGSVLLEQNASTGALIPYIFDAESKTWIAVS